MKNCARNRNFPQKTQYHSNYLFLFIFKKGGVAGDISSNIENHLFSSELTLDFYQEEMGFAETPARAIEEENWKTSKLLLSLQVSPVEAFSALFLQ